MNPMLHQVFEPLDRSISSIETAFLRAGDGLGHGLQTFEQLGAGLASLMEEINSGGMATASVALERLSNELIRISGTLPEDAVTLQGLVTGNEAIAKRLQDLLENLRMITLIARSFRIEAVVFSEASDLDGFAREIGYLTNNVQKDVSRCADEHAKLTDQLRRVAKAQVDLDRNFREKLLVLASELSEIFSLIQERQRAGFDLMDDVGTRSKHISQAAGMAMISLQAGDSTRQRLEHVADAARWVESLSGEAELAMDVPPEARKPTATALCRLQAAQLGDAVDCFGEDAGQIDRALERLSRDTYELVERGQATYGSTGKGNDTFLTVFRTRLSTATELLRTCEASRQYVERAAADLHVMLESLNETAATLSTTSLDLVLVGLNAGLKAVRLGLDGRSLVVIADEMKRLGQVVSREAPNLIRVFAEVRDISLRLNRGHAGEGSGSAEADREIIAILGALDSGDRKIAAFLSSLSQKAATFDADLTQARRQFSVALAMNRELLDAAQSLESFANGIDDGDGGAEGALWAGTIMQPKYTMASEREVHAKLLGALDDCGTAFAPSATGATDDWSFADADAAA